MVKYFIEIVNVDNKMVDISKKTTDTICKLTSRKIDLDANTFFSESFVFSTKNNTISYNFLNRKNQWMLQPKNRQEKWASIHFLYESE